MNEIPVRSMPFEYPDDVELMFVKGDPISSYGFLGASMTLPYIEPYMIRTMREGLKQVTDPDIKEAMTRFSQQEGHHYRQHQKLNEVIRSRSGQHQKLELLEKALESDYRRFSDTKSLRFNLAYAEGFEAATMNSVRSMFEIDFFSRMEDGPLRDLFRWHFLEEMEHRTATFEAYDHIFGSYPYRVVAGLYGQIHFFRYVKRFTDCLLAAAPEALPSTPVQAEERAETQRMGKQMSRLILPRVLASYLPGYHPCKVAMPSGLADWSAEYSAMALRAS